MRSRRSEKMQFVEDPRGAPAVMLKNVCNNGERWNCNQNSLIITHGRRYGRVASSSPLACAPAWIKFNRDLTLSITVKIFSASNSSYCNSRVHVTNNISHNSSNLNSNWKLLLFPLRAQSTAPALSRGCNRKTRICVYTIRPEIAERCQHPPADRSTFVPPSSVSSSLPRVANKKNAEATIQ